MSEPLTDRTTLRRLGVVILILCGIAVGLLLIVGAVSRSL